MAGINLQLDTRRKRKDNTYPLIFRLNNNGKTIGIRTGYNLLSSDFDKRNRKIRSSYKDVQSVKRLNNKLKKQLEVHRNKLIELEENNQLHGLSIKELKDELTGNRNTDSVFGFFKVLEHQMRKAKKVGNADAHRDTRRTIQYFTNNNDLSFKEIDFKWLSRFKTYYLSQGNTINGFAFKIRTLRAVYNKAIKSKIVDEKFYPFKDFTVKTDPTKKLAIDIETIKLIQGYKPNTKRKQWAKDYFLASFFMRGMNFIDMAHLRVSENIIDGRVKYRRQKTKMLFDIKITAPLQAIFDRYLAEPFYKDYIFPIISSDEPERQYSQVKNYRSRYNKALKDIAKELGITAQLSSNVARHSFATNLKFRNVEIAVISEALGHSNVEVTKTYLDSFENHVLDEASAGLIREFE